MATGSSAKTAQKKIGDTVKKPSFNDHLFLGGIEGILRANEMMTQDEKRDDSAAYWDALGTWGATLDKPYQEEFESAVDAINSFEAWLVATNWHYEEPVLYHAGLITVTMTMQAPSGEISISLQGSIVGGVELQDGIKAMKKDLQAAISAAFPRSAERPSGKSKHSSNGAKDNTPKTESVDFETLKVERRNNRIEARLIPVEGKWTQFGVALYPNVAEKLGFDIPEKPGEYSISGNMTYELKEDGKPKRVVKIDVYEEE